MPEKSPPRSEFQWEEDKILKALSRKSAVENKINASFDELMHPFTVLVLIEAKQYAEVKNVIMQKYGVEFNIIYITLNAGYMKITQDFDKEGMKYDRVFFIDMVSTESGAGTKKAGNVAYLNSPSNLTEAMMLVDKKLGAMSGQKCLLVLDSVSTMMIYNNATTVEKFIHTLLGKINAVSASAVVFSADFEERDSITSTIGQFFDKTIKV